MSRDPIGEEGGYHLYAFVTNSPLIHHDVLGRIPALYPRMPVRELWRFVKEMAAFSVSGVRKTCRNLATAAPSQCAVGAQIQASFVPGTSGFIAGLNVMFFPESCEIATYRFINGAWEPTAATTNISQSSKDLRGILIDTFRSVSSFGASLGVSGEGIKAVPGGPPPHDANSWTGWFYEIGAATSGLPFSFSGFKSADDDGNLTNTWTGASFGGSAGPPGAMVAATFFTRYKRATIDLSGSKCLCCAMRFVSLSQPEKLQQALKGLVK